MLMQNFKSAADLRITEPQLSALQKTLVLLETGKLIHYRGHYLRSIDAAEMGCVDHFNMRLVSAKADCGTVGCICGIAQAVGTTREAERWRKFAMRLHEQSNRQESPRHE